MIIRNCQVVMKPALQFDRQGIKFLFPRFGLHLKTWTPIFRWILVIGYLEIRCFN